MPIYEYECPSCKHRFEARVPIARRDKASCPKCGRAKARRQVSMFYSQKSGTGGSASSCSTCSGGSCSTCR